MNSKLACLVAGLSLAVAPVTAFAQEQSTNRVAAKTDWSVFVEESNSGGKKDLECWSVSAPKETVNTRDGRVVAVRRGDILLMVFFKRDAV